MGNFIENTFEGIGNAAKGLFGSSGSSNSENSQRIVALGKKQTAQNKYDEPVQGNLTEAQMDDLRARTMSDYRSTPGTSGGVPMKKGGAVKMAKGGSVSARADGCAQRGKTKGRFV